MALQMNKSRGISRERHILLTALGYPQYRLLWISGLNAWVGRWIETVVCAWLVLELTNSPFLVGLLGTCRFASMLLGPFCGTVCDRINERLVLLAVQVVYGTASLTVLALFAFAQIEVWHLFVFTFIGGLCFTFDFSARYSIAVGIVKDHHIVSSISLMQVASGATSVVGPLIGGSLLEVIGATGCFTLIAVSFLLSWLALLPLKVVAKAGMSNRGSIWRELVSGLRYIKGDRLLLSLVFMAAMVNLFIFPYSYTLMPIFARDILGTGAGGFGQLMAGAGLGAILGSLVVGSLPQYANRGKFLIGAILAWPVILMALSFSKSFQISMALLMMAGITQGISMALVQALLMIRSTEEMRGRVSGARAFAISTLSLGTFLTGYEASLWGAPTALVINTSVFILITTLMVIWVSDKKVNRRT
jgi:MFS family permease